MTIDIVCSVVDNLGDIGFVYRLARSLSELKEKPNIRIIVDDLYSFSLICPGIHTDSRIQNLGDWTIISWENEEKDISEIYENDRVHIVIECYACGHPQWFDTLLFDSSNTQTRCLVNLEYLTAEEWSVDFHLLPCITCSPFVKKTIFMPGFRKGTGGLIQDLSFNVLIEKCSTSIGRKNVKKHFLSELLQKNCDDADCFWITIFSYEHNFDTVVKDIASFKKNRAILVFVAHGKSSVPFLNACKNANFPFSVVELPMLEQKSWDVLLAASDFLFVRGEESLSRAVLSGNPFLWECYPFVNADNELKGHHSKIEALVTLLLENSKETSCEIIRQNMYCFNHFDAESKELKQGSLLLMLEKFQEIRPIFTEFAQKTKEVGNLAEKLMTFLGNIG